MALWLVWRLARRVSLKKHLPRGLDWSFQVRHNSVCGRDYSPSLARSLPSLSIEGDGGAPFPHLRDLTTMPRLLAVTSRPRKSRTSTLPDSTCEVQRAPCMEWSLRSRCWTDQTRLPEEVRSIRNARFSQVRGWTAPATLRLDASTTKKSEAKNASSYRAKIDPELDRK